MNRVLVITSILPIEQIVKKKNENDILLKTEDNIVSRFSDISFKYIFIFPFSNKLLSKLTSKWNSYYELKIKDNYNLKGRIISLLPVLLLPKKTFLWSILVEISLFQQRRRIQKIIKEFKPTVLHAQDTGTSAYIAKKICLKHNIPYVVTLRGLYASVDCKVRDNISKASSIIAISQQQVVNGERITDKNISLIPHGIDNSFFLSNVSNVSNVSNKHLKIILVSRLLSLKNINLIISALKHFQYDFQFDIYGDGPQEEKLKLLVDNLGLNHRVYFKGRVLHSQLPSIYPKYDIFIMPSYPEGLGRVYFEAMASGLPVIGAKNTGIDGLITEGIEGYIINPLKPDEFEDKLLRVLNGLIENPEILSELKDNAIRFSKKFTWNNVVSKYYRVYNLQN